MTTTLQNSDLGKLFEPDTLSQDQFYSTMRKCEPGDPERRLMVAVLEDVVACLSIDLGQCSSRQRLDFYDAQAWINAPNNSNWVFSFSSICETLGLDPEYLRRGLNQWVTKPDRGVKNFASGARRIPRHKRFRLRAAT